VKQLEQVHGSLGGASSTSVVTRVSRSTSPPKKRGLFSSYDRHLVTENAKPSAATVVTLYVDSLPALAVEARSAADPWRTFRSDTRFTDPHKLMENILCIPTTSAPVERIFSHGGIFMRPHRARLGPKVLSHLVFTKCNRHLMR